MFAQSCVKSVRIAHRSTGGKSDRPGDNRLRVGTPNWAGRRDGPSAKNGKREAGAVVGPHPKVEPDSESKCAEMIALSRYC